MKWGTADMTNPDLLDLVLLTNFKKTRFYKCHICGDQFQYKRLLEVHKKRCSGGSSK